jgi:hypothetical protein
MLKLPRVSDDLPRRAAFSRNDAVENECRAANLK